MAYLGEKKISETSPNHPFAGSHISFVAPPSKSSSSASPTPSKGDSASAPSDPMLAAHNGLEEAMLRQAEAFRNTDKASQAQSSPKDSTTPDSSAAS